MATRNIHAGTDAFACGDKRPRVAAYSEFEQYEYLREHLPMLGLKYTTFNTMRWTAHRDRFRAWITDHVVFVNPRTGAPCIVRPGVVRMLQTSPEFLQGLREIWLAARTDVSA